MNSRTARVFAALAVLAAFAVTGWLYPSLPERIPTHWDVAGRANGFSSKPWGPFVLPLIMAGVAGLFALLPRIAPKGYRIESFARAFDVIGAVTVGFLGFAHTLALLQASCAEIAMERWIPAGVGALLMVIGNFLGKTTKNFFLGIRTPWTLASDEVWLRTHRLAGKLFVFAGVLVVAGALAGMSVFVVPIAVGVSALVPLVYSFWLYRRLEGFGPNGKHDRASHHGR